MLDQAAKQGAQAALQQLQAQAAEEAKHLDNGIPQAYIDTPLSEGVFDMAQRKRFNVTLPTGEQVWLTGRTISEAFARGLQKYGGNTQSVIPKGKSFAAYTEEWWNLYKVPKHKQSTLSSYRNVLDKHILPYFGKMTFDTIDTNTVQYFINQHFDMSRSSVHHMVILLHEICEAAIEDGYMLKDPTASKRLTLPTRRTTREALSTADYLHILRQLPKLSPSDATLTAILAYTGMRRGEVLGLQWRDIDLDVGLIDIVRSVTFKANQPIVGTPKSNAGYRQVPIVKELIPFLHKQQEDLFVIGGENEPVTESTFDRAWQRIARTIDLHGATPHILRHTYLTTLGATSTNIKTIQAIAGHADIQTTMNRYVHRRNESIHAAGMAFSNLTSNLSQAGA